jgi:hypothetical protein
MLRLMRISTLTGERPRYFYTVPFVVLSLCSRNNVEFGRAGDMIYHGHDDSLS